jgi:NitT/TauT family transport system permease protein
MSHDSRRGDGPQRTHPLDVLLQRSWGQATAAFERTRHVGWVDLLVLAGIAGLVFGARGIAHEWNGVLRPSVVIDLSPWALPRYTLFSLSRGLIAYVFSLGFTLVYGYWAARDRVAERVLIPLLDILQSIPILGFMPGLVLALVGLFPHQNFGLELAAVIMMFTGQVWNMTFSFYHSLRAVPNDLNEVGAVYRYTWWERFKWVELPYSMMGLVWNSMMSMAGGWFFLMINEAFVLGDHDFRLPGIGSYMSVAVAHGDLRAMAWAMLAMVLMIVALDQLLWRPVVVWAQKFRMDEGGHSERATSWFLEWLHRSRLLRWAHHWLERRTERRKQPRPVVEDTGPAPPAPVPAWARPLSVIAFLTLMVALAAGAWSLVILLRGVSPARWFGLLGSSLLTLSRVLAATALGTLWTLPAGLAIGLSQRLSRILQPVVQIAASFPAPMLFPIAIAVLHAAGISLGWGSIVLMLLGTQWYVLFNVVAGAMAIPGDLREAAQSYRMSQWTKLRTLYAPAVFPYLVTGWVTAAGGAWNASIVSEYVTYNRQVLTTRGVGSAISVAAERADFPTLAAGVLVMSAIVVAFNRTVWRRCYDLAEARFSLNR